MTRQKSTSSGAPPAPPATVMTVTPPGSGSGSRPRCSHCVTSTRAPLWRTRNSMASGPKPVKIGT